MDTRRAETVGLIRWRQFSSCAWTRTGLATAAPAAAAAATRGAQQRVWSQLQAAQIGNSQQGASAVTWLAEEAACSYSSKDVAQDHSQHSGAQDQLATRGAGQLQAPGSEASCQMHVAEIKTSC
jgi:hypothetical protein